MSAEIANADQAADIGATIDCLPVCLVPTRVRGRESDVERLPT